MDLRNLPDNLTGKKRCDERRSRIEVELRCDLSRTEVNDQALGHAEERNCENMFGHVPIPVGYAGPLDIELSNGVQTSVHLPLATTEGALVASVNRGCKALQGLPREAPRSGAQWGVQTSSEHIGISRSIAFRMTEGGKGTACRAPDEHSRGSNKDVVQGSKGTASRAPDKSAQDIHTQIEELSEQWIKVGESTSNHLKILSYDIDISEPYIYLTIYGDTDEAMGMNMITIAAQAISTWLTEEVRARHASTSENAPTALAGTKPEEVRARSAVPPLSLVTIAANVDSDKKPSKRTHEKGRGYKATAEATIDRETCEQVLKSTPEAMLEVAAAKLEHGSQIAGALGSNLHAANIIAALYLATGQDAAHVVEGSLADTSIICSRGHPEHGRRADTPAPQELTIKVSLPAILIGVRGGGTTLPAQNQCLNLLLGASPDPDPSPDPKLHPCQKLAEIIAASVLAGELSLLAAQAAQDLAKAHNTLGR